MKIVAIERDLKVVDWKNETQNLIEEAKSVYRLMLSGILREIYFSENKQAILILECEDKIMAKNILTQLPLVINGTIDFDIIELHPYTGFGRLMEKI